MSTQDVGRPAFADLTPTQAWELLRRNHVGRLAFFNHGFVDMEPVHYVARDDWLFVRSAEGAKVEVFPHHPYVAFEVDEVDGMFDWKSVVAHGTVYMMADEGARIDRAIFDMALEALRSLMPAAMSENDPTPERRRVYGIHVDRVTARVATTRRRVPAVAQPPHHSHK